MKTTGNTSMFVLASANPEKVEELREILTGININVVTRQELGVNIDVDETGESFVDNATLKAKAICEATGIPSIADDSGLMVDALGGAPGLYTSSFGGENLDNKERCHYLLEVMDGAELRNATFISSIVCAFPDGSLITAQGECKGSIAAAPRGNNGFGYDPVFIAEGMDKTMAELGLIKSMKYLIGVKH